MLGCVDGGLVSGVGKRLDGWFGWMIGWMVGWMIGWMVWVDDRMGFWVDDWLDGLGG